MAASALAMGAGRLSACPAELPSADAALAFLAVQMGWPSASEDEAEASGSPGP